MRKTFAISNEMQISCSYLLTNTPQLSHRRLTTLINLATLYTQNQTVTNKHTHSKYL